MSRKNSASLTFAENAPRPGLLLTAEQLAAELGVSIRTVATLRQQGRLPVVDLGYRTKLFRLADVLRTLDRRTTKVT